MFSASNAPNKQDNGFKRNFIPYTPDKISQIAIQVPLSQIAGTSNSSIFLSGEDPRAVLVLDKRLKSIDTIIINAEIPTEKLVPSTLFIDSPMLYLHVNNTKTVIWGKFPNQTLNAIELKTEIFSKSVQISDSFLIIRAFNLANQNQLFKKMNAITGEKLQESTILDFRGRKALSSDGMLLYSKKKGKVFFIEFFTNKFYCIDTNLTRTYAGNTIDTTNNSHDELGINDITDEGKLEPTHARTVVNKYSFLNENNLFIISGLRSDDETLNSFSKNNVIDVYKISDGKYIGSFMLPKISKSNLLSCNLFSDTLAMLYSGTLALYKLPRDFQ